MKFINNIMSVFQPKDKILWTETSKIIIDPELENIFIQKETEIANISENMKENGFDPTHPIILAVSKDHPELNNINADGHTRYKAAIRAGVSKVAVIYKEFTDREELLKFVYQQQLLRRNLSESEIFNAWSALNRLTNDDGKKAKSDSVIAEELQISRRQVSKMKEVEKKATSEVLESIKSGELTINKAYIQIKQEEAASREEAEEPANEIMETSMPEVKECEKSSKTKKVHKSEYLKGYSEGWNYVFEALKFGKSIDVLAQELADLKSGAIAVESLQESLIALKESNESQQTK